MYLINCFFIYSILGFLLESTFNLIKSKHFTSGILFGPWTPIYGVGAIITIIISKKIFKKLKTTQIKETLITFLLLAITLTITEYISGILIEKIFHITMWNYKKYNLNIGKYISLEMTLIWGILSIILIYIIKPLIDKIQNKIPKKLTIILSIFFVIDLIVTILIKIKES